MLRVTKDLKNRYVQTRFCEPDDDGEGDNIMQLLSCEHFVNVRLKKHDKRQKEKEIENIASIMREGLTKHVDNSSSKAQVLTKLPQLHDDNCMEPIMYYEISDIFDPIKHEDDVSVEPMILVSGAPGVGKTTLCKEIAYRWAKGSLLKNNSLVFLLFLRDPDVLKIHELKDLIHYFYEFDPSAADLSSQFAKMLFEGDHGDMTILLDGFDEFNNTDKSLLINKIIHRKVLIQSKLVITSRPISLEKLQRNADITVEVLGFNEENKLSFIENELEGFQSKISYLTSFLNTCSYINSSCYLPIMIKILVHIFKHHDELPNDEAELYATFVFLTISRFLKKLEINTNPPVMVKCLNNLPEVYKNYIGNLSKLAFESIKINKIVFTKEDIEGICNNFDLDFNNFHGLGLLNYTEYTNYSYIDKVKKCIYYNFLHLSIQEFLAAYYVNSLGISDQFQLLKRTFFVDRYIPPWIMFIQINKSNVCRFHQFKTYSYALESSNESKCNVMSILNSLNLFDDLSRINSINPSKIVGTFQVLCYKDTEQSLRKQETRISTYDAFWFLKRIYYQHGVIKIYLSLRSVDDNVSQLMEVFMLDMNTGESAYHHMVAALEDNQNVAVVLVSSNTFLAYRAKSHQISHALTLINDSLSTLFMRDCHVTIDFANIVSSYLRDHPMTKRISITNQKRKTITQLQPLLLITKALKTRNNLISIDLDNNHLSEKVLCDLADAIKNNINLEEVSLNDNNLGSSARVILKALKEISKLKCLYLSSNNLLSEAVGNLLADVIQTNTYLEVLNLSINNLLLSAKVILKALSRVSSIRNLNLSQTNLTDELTDGLADVIRNNVCLEVLYLSNNNLQSPVAILQALKGISTLKKLSLFGNILTKEVDQDLADVVTSNASLETLILGNNNLQSCALISALVKITSLKILDLGGNNLSSQAMQDLANVINNNINLEVLFLNNINLQSSISLILQALKGISNLRKLHLHHTNIPVKVVKELADVIKSNVCLEDLDLSYNVNLLEALLETSNLKILNLSGIFMPEEVVDCLANVIKSNPCLEALSLDGNKLKSSAVVMLHALRETSNLRKLKLNSNKMPVQVVCDLADTIKHKVNLEEIQLLNNNLRSSAISILNVLQTVNNLKVLSLDTEGMSTEETSCLADVIRCNPYFEKLELFSVQSSLHLILQALKEASNLKILILVKCNLSTEMEGDLTDIMNSNTSLEELGLCYCTESFVLVMIKALKRVSILKKLNLQGNNMSGKVANDLADMIKNNHYLEEIYLGSNDLQKSVNVVLEALQEIRYLKKLDLRRNNLSGEVANHLADVIRNNVCLEELHLAFNNLQSSIVIALQALKSASHLKVLNLISNDMPGEVVADLAHVIEIQPSLHILWLDLNGLQSSAAVVFQAMKKLMQLRILILNSSMSRNMANYLADVIKNNSYLEVLSLSNNNLQSSADVILQALEGLTNLKILDIGNNRMSGKALHSLSHVLRNNNILWLEIGGNDLPPGITIASHAGSQLQALFVNDTNLNVTAVSGLLATLNHNHTLSDLWLGDNNLLNGLLSITKCCSVLPNLESLELSHNACGISDVANLASNVSNISSLKSLIFGGVTLSSKEYFYIRVLTVLNELQNSTAKEIYSTIKLFEVVILEMQNYMLGSSIKYSYTVKLRVFMFTQSTLYCHVNINKVVCAIEQWFKCTTTALSTVKSSLQNLLQVESEIIVSTLNNSIKTLAVLDLEYSNIGEDAATKLAEGIQCNNVLEQLWLRGNVLCDKGAGLILNSLQSVRTLLVLDLSFNNISSKSSDDIVAVIKSNCSLEQLWLDGNYLQTAGIVRIANALQYHCKLRLLSLSKNGITEDAGEALHAIFCNNVSIEVLILGKNRLQLSGISELSKACYCLVRLIKLDLFDNQITKDCANGLADIIKSCSNLQELFLGDNMLETTGALKVLEAIKSICSLRIFTLSNNKINKEAASSICDVINKHFDLKVLLLGGNELQSDGVRIIAKAVKRNEALQLLAVCDNSVDEQTKEDIKVVLSSNLDLHLYI